MNSRRDTCTTICAGYARRCSGSSTGCPLTETNRHAGHADILREQLDGAVGTDPQSTAPPEFDAAYWENHRAKIEQAALARSQHSR